MERLFRGRDRSLEEIYRKTVGNSSRQLRRQGNLHDDQGEKNEDSQS